MYNDTILLMILASASQFTFAFLLLKCSFLAMIACVQLLSPVNGQLQHFCSYFEGLNVMVQAYFSTSLRKSDASPHQTHLFSLSFVGVSQQHGEITQRTRLPAAQLLHDCKFLSPQQPNPYSCTRVFLTNGAAANTALKQSSKCHVQWATFSDKEGAPCYLQNMHL